MKPLPDAAARRAALAAIDRSLLVEAGAGSGKTALMAGRVAVLFANGVEPKHVAAVTFTEFAASELLQRITRFAEALARGEVPSELTLAFASGISAEQQAQVQRACNAIDQLTCTTIHGFAQKLIKPYPAEADMDPGAEIIDPAEADLAFEERKRISAAMTMTAWWQSWCSPTKTVRSSFLASWRNSCAATAMPSRREETGPARPSIDLPPLQTSSRTA